jgi:hypothetical protein
MKILKDISDAYGLRFQLCDDVPLDERSDVALYMHSWNFDHNHLRGREFRGTHMLRDPRDMVVSAYYYHLHTDEAWVHRPRDLWGGMSLQSYLNSLDVHDGIMVEIQRFGRGPITSIAEWNYNQPEFLELHYEDVIDNQAEAFQAIFNHYGFNAEALRTGLEIVERRSLRGMNSWSPDDLRHVRSGAPGQWREAFSPDHAARFKELSGDLLVRLGYESNMDWTP